MKFERHENPNRYASGYTLDLYCDRKRDAWTHYDCASFYGQTFTECAREAKSRGWRIRRDQTATCPVCLGLTKHDND